MSGDPTTDGRVPSEPVRDVPPARALPGDGDLSRHVLVAIVLDKPGVLNRVASLMRARNFNIDSLAVSHTARADISRMTITLHGDAVAVEQADHHAHGGHGHRHAPKCCVWASCHVAGWWTCPTHRSSWR